MEYSKLGRTGWQISRVSFGAWGIGGDAWGPTDDDASMRVRDVYDRRLRSAIHGRW